MSEVVQAPLVLAQDTVDQVPGEMSGSERSVGDVPAVVVVSPQPFPLYQQDTTAEEAVESYAFTSPQGTHGNSGNHENHDGSHGIDEQSKLSGSSFSVPSSVKYPSVRFSDLPKVETLSLKEDSTRSDTTFRSYSDYGSIGKRTVSTASLSEASFDRSSFCSQQKLPYPVEIYQEYEHQVVEPPSSSAVSAKAKAANAVRSLLSWCGQQIQSPSEQAGRVLALVAAIIYGTNFASVKVLDETIPLAIAASLRFSVAAGAVTCITLYQEARAAKANKENAASATPTTPTTCTTSTDNATGMRDVDSLKVLEERSAAFWCGVEIGAWYAVAYICQAKSLEVLEAGKNAFFNALAVVLVPLLDVAIRGRILKCQDMIGIALALLGVATLEMGPTGVPSFTSSDLLAFGQTVFFGIGYWRLEAHSQTHSKNDARLTVGQLSAVAVGSMIFVVEEYGWGGGAVMNGGTGFPSVEQVGRWLLDPVVVEAVLWTGLMSTALALYLETVALKAISASELTLLMTTVSIWGAAFAYVTLGEVLSTTGFVGGGLILAGCVLGNLPMSVSPSSSASGSETQLIDEEKQPLNSTYVPEDAMSTTSMANTIDTTTGWVVEGDIDLESGCDRKDGVKSEGYRELVQV